MINNNNKEERERKGKLYTERKKGYHEGLMQTKGGDE